MACSVTFCAVAQFVVVKVSTETGMLISPGPLVEMVIVTSEVGAAVRAIRRLSSAPPSVTTVVPRLSVTERPFWAATGGSKVTVRTGAEVPCEEENSNPSAPPLWINQPKLSAPFDQACRLVITLNPTMPLADPFCVVSAVAIASTPLV